MIVVYLTKLCSVNPFTDFNVELNEIEKSKIVSRTEKKLFSNTLEIIYKLNQLIIFFKKLEYENNK